MTAKTPAWADSVNTYDCVSITGTNCITKFTRRQRDCKEAAILRIPAALAGLESIGHRGITAVTQYAKCRKAINRFLHKDRIGAIGHISCIDRRSHIADSADILAASANSLAGICDLLGYEPASVTAQSQQNQRVTSLQAFLQVNSQTGIHYFATFGDGPREHELWIEGSDGSLRTDGNSVWWRKRGWPVFIPTRIGLFGAPSRSRSKGTGDSELAAALRKSAQDRETVSLANGG